MLGKSQANCHILLAISSKMMQYLRLHSLFIDLLKDVLESSVIPLQDGVLCAAEEQAG